MDKFTIEPFGNDTGFTPEPNYLPDEQTSYNYANPDSSDGYVNYESAQYNPNNYNEDAYPNTNYMENSIHTLMPDNGGYMNTNRDNSNYNETTAYTDFESNEYEESNFDDDSSNETTVDVDANSVDSVSESLYTPLIPGGMSNNHRPQSALDEHSSDNDSLTEAERADIRRQKERARRKKLAARERRRKKRMQQAIIRCGILLLIVILLISGFVALVSGIIKSQKKKQKERQLSEYYATSEITTEEPVANIDEAIVAKEIPTDRNAALAILQEQASSDTTMQSIYDSAAALPDIVLQNLAVNPEMKSFALNYPAMINIVFDGESSVDVSTDEVPLFLQFDERWGYADYSTDIIALRGAGPTCLSMAYVYLMKDNTKNPIKVADYATEMGYLDENGKTHWTLMTNGANGIGLKSEEIDVDKDAMVKALEDEKLLVCKVSAGDFTTEESFLLIREYKDGFFYVNDPNSAARSEVGWDFKRLRGQISKIAILEAGEAPADNGTTGENTGTAGDNTGTAGDDTVNQDTQSQGSDNGNTDTGNGE